MDKRQRRLKRKAKGSAMRPQVNLVPLDLPKEVNIYTYMKDYLNRQTAGIDEQVNLGLPSDKALLGAIETLMDLHNAKIHLAAADRTMDHFQIPAEGRERAGNVLLRLGVMMSLQTQKISISPDDRLLNNLFDMYEHYQIELDKEL